MKRISEELVSSI